MKRRNYEAGIERAIAATTDALSAIPATAPPVEIDALHATLDARAMLSGAIHDGAKPWTEYY